LRPDRAGEFRPVRFAARSRSSQADRLGPKALSYRAGAAYAGPAR